MDINIEELENILPRNRSTSTHHDRDLRVKQAAKYLLENCSGIISTLRLTKSIDKAAANLLVEEYLLLFTDDLFEDRDDVDPEGYIKLVPDVIDLIYIGRLLKYEVDLFLYLKTITLPEVWRARLSANGIRLLRTMEIYRNILDTAPSLELVSDEEVENRKYSKSYCVNSWYTYFTMKIPF